MIVAIDGPAGAGKSSVSLRVAETLGFTLIGTGSLYRAVAMRALKSGVAFDDASALAEIASALDVRFRVVDGENRVFVDGDDVTDQLRTPAVSDGASFVSAHAPVRDALMSLQRGFAAREDVVMEGRDIGTVIFPSAEVKVFLTASAEERARRRCADYAASGETADFAGVLREIQERDARDEGREVAPLRAADDAVLVDATELTVEAVVERIVTLVKSAQN